MKKERLISEKFTFKGKTYLWEPPLWLCLFMGLAFCVWLWMTTACLVILLS